MTNKTYDILKDIALILVPVIAFAASLIDIWGIPYGTQIVATLTAVDVLIGAIVKVAASKYNGGDADDNHTD